MNPNILSRKVTQPSESNCTFLSLSELFLQLEVSTMASGFAGSFSDWNLALPTGGLSFYHQIDSWEASSWNPLSLFCLAKGHVVSNQIPSVHLFVGQPLLVTGD